MLADGFLSRWSRLKHQREQAAARPPEDGRVDAKMPDDTPAAVSCAPERHASSTLARDAVAATASPTPTAAEPVRAAAGVTAAGDAGAQEHVGAAGPADALPSPDSLTPQSDFRPFLRAGVAAATRTAALKTLFKDPRFNVMDGLDVYIGDYTKSDPIPESMLRRLAQSKTLRLFDEVAHDGQDGAPDALAAAPGQAPAAPPSTARAPGASASGGGEGSARCEDQPRAGEPGALGGAEPPDTPVFAHATKPSASAPAGDGPAGDESGPCDANGRSPSGPRAPETDRPSTIRQGAEKRLS